MEIEREIKGCQLSRIKIGELFEHKATVYLRIDRADTSFNCVNVSSGYLNFISLVSSVMPLKSKVVIL